jgi:hypothetical protein
MQELLSFLYSLICRAIPFAQLVARGAVSDAASGLWAGGSGEANA